MECVSIGRLGGLKVASTISIEPAALQEVQTAGTESSPSWDGGEVQWHSMQWYFLDGEVSLDADLQWEDVAPSERRMGAVEAM